MKYLSNIINKHWLEIFLFVLLMIMCLSIVLINIYPTVHFHPLNGSYQNYNVVRRLLDGQTPYQDFVVYLGSMHLYLGSFFTWLFGNDFITSVFAFNFLTILTFNLLIYTVAKCFNFNNKKIIFSLIILISLGYILNCILPYSLLKNILRQCYSVCNSARLIRMLILPLACLAIMHIDYVFKKPSIRVCLYGLIAGIAFPCSNDYGVSTCVAITFIFLLSLIFDNSINKNKIKSLLQFGITLLISLLSSVLIFSKGHIFDYIEQMKGISSYQSWYFYGNKTNYLYQMNVDFLAVFQLVLTIFFIYKFFNYINNANQKEKIITYKILALLNLTASIVTQELNYFGDKTYILSVLILMITLIFYIIYNIESCIPKFNIVFLNQSFNQNCQKLFLCLAIVLSLGIIGYNTYLCTKKCNDINISELGKSSIDQYALDIIDAKNYIGNEKIFSTYATALEDITGQFQPSGYDYIIHVLGDNARNNYLKSFKEQKFKYVTTQRAESSRNWEYWVRRSNWFFYRELYADYKPVYYNNYLTFYEKNNKEVNLLPVSTILKYEKMSKTTGKIILITDKNINGFADLKIDFDLNEKNLLSKCFLFKKLLKVYDDEIFQYSINNNYIYVSNKHSQLIPIPIINGHGEIFVESVPKHNVELVIKSLSYGNYYESPMKFIEIQEVDYDNNIIKIKKSYLNERLITNVKSIKLDSDIYKIANISLNDNDINIDLDKNIVKSDNKQYFLEIME